MESILERATKLSSKREYNIIADLHCHTLASSHAYSTVTELAQAAAPNGLIAVGCTDHGIGMEDSPHLWHFLNLRDLPDKIAGVRVLRGVEANVTGFDGYLDMPVEVLERLELVVVSMHGGLMPSGTVDECTQAWLAVAENPYVDIIGHSGSPEYAYDYETVLKAAAKNGKAVELNEHSFAVRTSSIKNCRIIAALCKKLGVPVSIDSDSHYHDAVGHFPNCYEMLREIDFPPELIINSSVESMNRFFKRKNITFD
jgi:putative hydrolase